MKPRDLQFDRRKGPDSPRVHGLRVVIDPFPNEELKVLQKSQDETQQFISGKHIAESFELPAIDGMNGATGERRRESSLLLTVEEVACLLHVPVSWVYERSRRRGPEQLPHFKIGKYLRFEVRALTDFIQRQRRA
jgi:Helix-turn-helix domain